MKKAKAVFWFVLWGVSITLGSIFSAAEKFKRAGTFSTFLYEDYQIFLLLVFLPLVLLPMLCISCYHAHKENNKKVKLASSFFIIHHIICVVAVLFQIL